MVGTLSLLNLQEKETPFPWCNVDPSDQVMLSETLPDPPTLI